MQPKYNRRRICDDVVLDNHIIFQEDLQKTLQEWSNTFRKHGLRMNLEKTEVMRIGEQEVDLCVVVDGKTIKQVNSFVYLGGTVCEDGGSSKETQRRVQAGAAAWRRVEGIMWDRKLKKQLKGKVLEACVVPVSIYGLGTLAQRHEDADSNTQLDPKNMQSNPIRYKEDEGIERSDWHEKNT